MKDCAPPIRKETPCGVSFLLSVELGLEQGGGCGRAGGAEPRPYGGLLPFAIQPGLVGVGANIGRSRAPPLRAVYCYRLPFIQPWRVLLPRCGPPGRRPLRRELILACGQPACYQSAAGVGGTRRSRPTEGWQVFGGTGADRVVRPYELVGIARRGSGGAEPRPYERFIVTVYHSSGGGGCRPLIRHGGRFVNRPYGETATLSTAGTVPHCPPPIM